MDASIASEGEAAELIRLCFAHLLRREPAEAEVAAMVADVTGKLSAAQLIQAFAASPEYRDRTRVGLPFPAGHFYSPIVDPETVEDYVPRARRAAASDLHGIDCSIEAIMAVWGRLLPVVASTPFPEEKTPTNRYYYRNTSLSYADAITLRAMIGLHRPSRIIEVGSGFSTACMLDSADEFALSDLAVTCIEPYPALLQSLLRRQDADRLRIIASPIQEVPDETFRSLQAGDILFIDSTHVLKTGSDVHYELFSILPVLKPGVLVHFHDIHYPFEYPDDWVFRQNLSWNEAYGLRAFLMYNSAFEIYFWYPMLAHHCREALERDYAPALRNTGGSIWLRRT